ncbi:MAG: type 1 glutamine amidotransferase [Deltaproteobacteria bacterium]|nr:type 1 glutamine amidotransferase [Deltaproteobacteria bacterium]
MELYMRVHYLQHVAFENSGCFEQIFTHRGDTISCTRLFAGETPPSLDDFDWLVIMGGPMSIFDEPQYPWLASEKHFIKSAIDADKTVLGICLGAQLLAHVLGARVYANTNREIGWFELTPAADLPYPELARVFFEPFPVFNWHGDTFDIPDGANRLGGTPACVNQGFVFEGNVVALQFHLETTPQSAKALVQNCADELDGSTYVQSADEILAPTDRFAQLNSKAAALIDAMVSIEQQQ